MKTTITIEITHKCKLPYALEKRMEQKCYDYLYAQGCEVGVRTLRAVTSLGDSESLRVDGRDQQNVFLASSAALRDDLAGTPR